ncbi:MAG TPA: hypothetical protein PLB62_00270 [Candidatus Sumerlaeota bacterium]|nr:hypothetical protein [Candidatus Sumerlaeota bacterium]
MGKEVLEEFRNNDDLLQSKAASLVEDRQKAGLEGLVGSLEAVIINIEPDRQLAAAEELVGVTGLVFETAYESDNYRTIVLSNPGHERCLVRSRKYPAENPFTPYNGKGKAAALPCTRLETFVFQTPDIHSYVRIQKERGVRFVSRDIIFGERFSFIQSAPSAYTGNSVAVIEWHGTEKNFFPRAARPLPWRLEKPMRPYLKRIGRLDHAASRVRAQDRDPAILEFMALTNYKFDFAIYVEALNSITNVARLSQGEFAKVFTSGITAYNEDAPSGPTELFIKNYGARVHHLAWETRDIVATVGSLKADGHKFLSDLVGSEDEGLRQIFSEPSPNTFLVNEYIQRYGDFDGFFTKSNVTHLTAATAKQ